MLAHAQPSLLRESYLSPISFFSRREATILLELGQRNTRNFTLRVGFIGIAQSRRKSIGPGLSNLCTQSVLTRQKLATCYSTEMSFTSFFLTQVTYDVLDKENLGNRLVSNSMPYFLESLS